MFLLYAQNVDAHIFRGEETAFAKAPPCAATHTTEEDSASRGRHVSGACFRRLRFEDARFGGQLLLGSPDTRT